MSNVAMDNAVMYQFGLPPPPETSCHATVEIER